MLSERFKLLCDGNKTLESKMKLFSWISTVLFCCFSVGTSGSAGSLCASSIDGLKTQLREQLALEKQHRFPFDRNLSSWTQILLLNLKEDQLCNPETTKSLNFMKSAGAWVMSSEGTPVFCKLCMDFMSRAYQAGEKLSILDPQLISAMMQRMPKADYYCSHLIPSCKGTLNRAPGSLRLASSNDTKCVECSACEVATTVMQFQIFVNRQEIEAFEWDLKTYICDNLFSNQTSPYLLRQCKKFAHEIATGLFGALHVIFYPDSFCVNNGYCKNANEANNPNECLKELCKEFIGKITNIPAIKKLCDMI